MVAGVFLRRGMVPRSLKVFIYKLLNFTYKLGSSIANDRIRKAVGSKDILDYNLGDVFRRKAENGY